MRARLRWPAASVAATLLVVAFAGPLAAADADAVVARRGTAEITLAEIDARLEEVPPDRRAGLMDSPERIDTLLQQMLLMEQLAEEAVAAGLDRDPRLAPQLELSRKRLLTALRLEKLRAEAAAQIDVDALARERFAADRANYVVPSSRTARHLLVSEQGRSAQDAEARVAALAKRLAAGERLEDLAREASDDATTRDAGGLIADIVPGATDPAFDAALQALDRPGAVTPTPVRSRFGWHLIELVSVTPARQRTYDEVREQLAAEITAANIDRKVNQHTDRLNSLPIEADPDLVASLRTRFEASNAPSKKDPP
ncbi:MAG: peptidylprolyl isomerase [Pseudomonadota bacterium]